MIYALSDLHRYLGLCLGLYRHGSNIRLAEKYANESKIAACYLKNLEIITQEQFDLVNSI